MYGATTAGAATRNLATLPPEVQIMIWEAAAQGPQTFFINMDNDRKTPLTPWGSWGFLMGPQEPAIPVYIRLSRSPVAALASARSLSRYVFTKGKTGYYFRKCGPGNGSRFTGWINGEREYLFLSISQIEEYSLMHTTVDIFVLRSIGKPGYSTNTYEILRGPEGCIMGRRDVVFNLAIDASLISEDSPCRSVTRSTTLSYICDMFTDLRNLAIITPRRPSTVSELELLVQARSLPGTWNIYGNGRFGRTTELWYMTRYDVRRILERKVHHYNKGVTSMLKARVVPNVEGIHIPLPETCSTSKLSAI